MDREISSDYKKKELPLTTLRGSSALPRHVGWKPEPDEKTGSLDVKIQRPYLRNTTEPQPLWHHLPGERQPSRLERHTKSLGDDNCLII